MAGKAGFVSFLEMASSTLEAIPEQNTILPDQL